MSNIIYITTVTSVTDVTFDYNLYVGHSFSAAKLAALNELKVNSNAQSVRVVEWDIVSQKALLVETFYQA